ncbi:MAG: DMT family transporter [Alphaproteobacteria bacterium]|nr:DMT family transporter [Alphaproteobacteria bacterium]
MSRRQAYLLLALAALFWATNPALGRLMVDSVTPVSLSFWRWTGALAILLPIALPRLIAERHAMRGHYMALLTLGFLSVSGFTTLVYVGLSFTTATNLSLLNGTMPIMILIVARLVLGHAIGSRRILGVAVCLTGVALIVAQGSLAVLLDFQLNPGDPIILLAMFCWALYSVLLAKVKLAMHPFSLHLAAFIAGWVMLGLGFAVEAIFFNAWWPTPDSDPAMLAGLAFLSLFPSVLAFLFWQKGIAVTGPGTAGYFIYLVPVFGTLLAVATLGEQLYWYHWAGMAAIFLGIFLAQRGARVKA